MRNRVLPTAIVALVGAIVGSFVMMLYASTHFANVAGPNNTPPAVNAAPLTGGSDQERIVNAVKRTKPSVVAISVTVNESNTFRSIRTFNSFSVSRDRTKFSPSAVKRRVRDSSMTTRAISSRTPTSYRPPVPNATVSNIQVLFPNNVKKTGKLIALTSARISR